MRDGDSLTQDKRKLSWIAWKKLVTSKKEGGLGFRDFHLFNQALLANHAWKIIKRPDSLIYRLLKARYFSDRHFFSAPRGHKPSYGWNSLRFGRELLASGTQVNIGDGKQTHIGIDPWLPTNPSRPPRLLNANDSELFVDELIDDSTSQWNELQIQRLVAPQDHHIIYKIFLPQTSVPDDYIWNCTKDGNYTVKSGYSKALTLLHSQDTPKAPLAANPDIANSIWKLDITPKLQHFVWRIASRALGVAENLRRRNINVNPYCSRCCVEIETSDHTLFTCPHVIAIWKMAGLPTLLLGDEQITIEDKLRFLFHLHRDPNTTRKHRYAPFWLMWRIWKSRNNLNFNHKVIDPKETMEQAIIDTEEWLTHTTPQSERHNDGHTRQLRGMQWKKPDQGWVKCNYDASHYEGDKDSGLGWIIRDSNGKVLHAGMGKFQGRATTEEAECTALLWALQSAWSLGYRDVEFEGDNLIIISLVNGPNSTPRLRHYLDTIQQWRLMFTLIRFKFKHREQNQCSDLLAKTATRSSYPYMLYDSCPNFLINVVNNDIRSVS